MGGDTLLRLTDLHYSYPNGTRALRGVDLEIEAGAFIGLIGQNGSGKTTLAKHLNGLLRPSQGEIRFKGEDHRRMVASNLSTEVGYVFQNPDHQIFLNSVHDEIAFGPRNLKLSEEEVAQRVDTAARLMDLEEVRENHPQTLSRGQRQRLAIASVLAMETDVIVLDEPTGGQDRLQARKLLHLLRELNRAGRTVVLITHDLELAGEYCGHLLVMGGGHILLEGPPEDVFAQDDVLTSTQLRAPDIYRLSRALGWANAALSVDAFVEQRAAQDAMKRQEV